MRKYFINLLFVLLVFSCGENITDPAPENKNALVILLESANVFPYDLEYIYDYYEDDSKKFLADIIGTQKETFDGLEFSEVLDDHLEPWLIDEITKVSKDHYNDIIVLTDDDATDSNFISAVHKYSSEDYTIDCIINLHADETGILFQDDFVKIGSFIDRLKEKQTNIRVIYQTCCYGGSLIKEYEKLGIKAMNGTKKQNYYAWYSCKYFMEAWISGETFRKSVTKAMEKEIKKLEEHSKVIPAISYIVGDDIKEGSTSIVGGTNPDLLW